MKITLIRCNISRGFRDGNSTFLYVYACVQPLYDAVYLEVLEMGTLPFYMYMCLCSIPIRGNIFRGFRDGDSTSLYVYVCLCVFWCMCGYAYTCMCVGMPIRVCMGVHNINPDCIEGLEMSTLPSLYQFSIHDLI